MEVVNINELRSNLSAYGNPDAKIRNLRKENKLFRVKRGHYIYNRVCKEAVSNIICKLSYVSFEDALSKYDLIPEQVFECSCATCGKKDVMLYKNDLGYYSFINIPKLAYPYGIVKYHMGQNSWDMASPEKAICDLLYTRKPLHDKYDLLGFLFEGMRIDESDFNNLNKKDILFFAEKYNTTNLKLLQEVLQCK